MPEGLAIALFLFFGVGLLIYVRQAWKSGEVRMGSNGMQAFTPSRDDSPLLFYIGILLYLCMGLASLIYAFMIMTGNVEVPPIQ